MQPNSKPPLSSHQDQHSRPEGSNNVREIHCRLPSLTRLPRILESSQKHKFRVPTSPPPLPPASADILAGLKSELECRQEIYLETERQLEACQNLICAHPSKQKNTKKELEKRFAGVLKLEHDEKRGGGDAERRKHAQTAEEAEIEVMGKIYSQYDRESIGDPDAESVDAFFGIIANTEQRLKEGLRSRKDCKEARGEAGGQAL